MRNKGPWHGCGWEHLHWDLVAPGDLNRDGRPDLVTIDDRTHCMMRWYGDGRGSFGTGLQIGCGWHLYQYNLAGLHDMNGDGNGDLIALQQGTILDAWYGVGNGGFTAFHSLTGPVWSHQRLVE
ncbi:VCBS repeat-containing protein [Micromonospora sp. CPCC 205371]|nr:VCBS repeat-containing protein [Micromonospora sp. CPCC 205371]